MVTLHRAGCERTTRRAPRSSCRARTRRQHRPPVGDGRPRSRGRTGASRIRELVISRRNTIPTGEISPNRLLETTAQAAPKEARPNYPAAKPQLARPSRRLEFSRYAMDTPGRDFRNSSTASARIRTALLTRTWASSPRLQRLYSGGACRPAALSRPRISGRLPPSESGRSTARFERRRAFDCRMVTVTRNVPHPSIARPSLARTRLVSR